jgi:hypothetical protein
MPPTRDLGSSSEASLATENTDDITHRLFKKNLDERREIPAHVSDPVLPEDRLSRRAFRLQALPFSHSHSIATLRVFEGYRILLSLHGIWCSLGFHLSFNPLHLSPNSNTVSS